MEMDRHFHLIALGAASKEKTENFRFFFDSLKTRILDIFNISIEPTILICDGAKAIQNAFKMVFGDDCLILMCWFHMKKAFDKHVKQLLPKGLRDEVISDLDTLQISQNPQMFEKASKLFLEKYASYEQFVQYFGHEWLHLNRNWYEGASPSLVPSTNNAEETFNRLLKDEKTLRRRLPLKEYVNCVHDWVKSWNIEYDRGAKSIFINEPTIDLKLWTKSYQWVHLKKVVKKSANANILLVPAKTAIVVDNFDTDVEWETFDDFKKTAFVQWQVDTSNEDCKKWTCNCPAFMKSYMCKHVVGVALRLKLAIAPDEAKIVPIGTKRKKGRPAKAKKALLVQ